MQLLVSVVHEEEVTPAIAGGADIIDVKNPREGSLGANFPHVIRRVRELTPPDVPVSAAIGDAPNLPGMVALAAAGAAMCGVQYIKVGLLGPREPRDALLLLTEVCRAAREQDPTVRIMATAYADAHRIGSFPPLDLPMVAAKVGVDGCMLDTASKNGATLLSELGAAELETFVTRCRSNGLICALAGSLREEDVPRIHGLGPDIMGVRTAACRGDRLTGRVDRDAVRRLKRQIAALGSLPSGPSQAALSDIPAVLR
ncbi:MAG: (5-formylfuran-3-yl)methyl phosphate synthase [Thermoleophilia bacterium]